MSYEIDREDIVLLLLDANQRLLGRSSLRGVTRLEKLIYLLGREKRLAGADNLFGFTAYKFGPFSKDVYEAAEFLRGLDCLEVEEHPLVSYYATTEERQLTEETSDDFDDTDEEPVVGVHEKVFTLTDRGKELAQKLRDIWQKEQPTELAKIDDVVKRFASQPLNQIIRYVYNRYPEMAVNSIHPEAAKSPRA